MAIKDWEKVTGGYIKKDESLSLSIIKYIKGGYYLVVTKGKPFSTKIIKQGSTSKDRIFKTKSAALKFAKAYMRKH